MAAVVCAVSAIWGCRSFSALDNGGKKVAQGAPYEVLVVCSAPEWEGAAGVELRNLLEQPVEMINQTEPLFSVLRITPNDFKNLLVNHRNILKVVVSPQVSEAAIAVQYDVTAAPQMVLTLQASTAQAMVDYLHANGDKLLYVLEMAERDRSVAYAQKHNVKALGDIIHEKFGVEMKVPAGFELRAQSEDFVWASYEFPTSSEGFFIYSYPAKGRNSLSMRELILNRNRFAKRIPGPSDGSWMTTVTRIPDDSGQDYIPFTPQYKVISIGGRVWVEMRGLWEVENDFMGGPFVSYSTIDEVTGRVLTFDGYVYSPKLGKRNLLRAVSHLVYLIEFPKTESVDVTPKNAE